MADMLCVKKPPGHPLGREMLAHSHSDGFIHPATAEQRVRGGRANRVHES